MSNRIIEVNDNNFEDIVINSSTLVIVDFWAEWCGPCKAIAPILDKISADFGDKLTIGKVNVDLVKETPVKFGIRSIPTLLFFKEGKIVRQEVGLLSEQVLTSIINQFIN
jgi:thioredoxin 1